MRFHISHQLQRYKWWTNILIVLGRQECLHLSEHVLYWSLVVQTFGALPGLVWLVYLRLRCTHTRSGGPSLRQSARYPSAFAKWVADQHANCMDSWLNMQHCVPASWLVWLLAIYSHRANKWDTHAYTHYNIYIYNCKSYIYMWWSRLRWTYYFVATRCKKKNLCGTGRNKYGTFAWPNPWSPKLQGQHSTGLGLVFAYFPFQPGASQLSPRIGEQSLNCTCQPLLGSLRHWFLWCPGFNISKKWFHVKG